MVGHAAGPFVSFPFFPGPKRLHWMAQDPQLAWLSSKILHLMVETRPGRIRPVQLMGRGLRLVDFGFFRTANTYVSLRGFLYGTIAIMIPWNPLCIYFSTWFPPFLSF